LDSSHAANVDDVSFQPDIFDPRYWDSLDPKQIDILAEKGHKRDLSIQKGPKDKFSRKFSALFYTRILPNGEECDRNWLVYSKELDKVFCFSCKIFSKGHDKVFCFSCKILTKSCCDHLGAALKRDGQSDIDADDLYVELIFLQDFIPQENKGPVEILIFLKRHECFPNATIAFY
jgi:hypothetical protein